MLMLTTASSPSQWMRRHAAAAVALMIRYCEDDEVRKGNKWMLVSAFPAVTPFTHFRSIDPVM
jgi:hypothetical protein